MQSIFRGRLGIELGAPADGVGTFAASGQAWTPELSEVAGSTSSVTSLTAASAACDLALKLCAASGFAKKCKCDVLAAA